LKLAAIKGDVQPFALLGFDFDPADFLTSVRNYVQRRAPVSATPLAKSTRPDSGRIKIAYMSSDFRTHPVGYLTARLFELHDRSNFEIIAISHGIDDRSPLRARLISAFDQFLDVHDRNDADIATLISEMDVDILVDLNGHTMGSRFGIL